MSAQCRSCGAPIVWTLTPAGQRAPIDIAPVENGNVLLVNSGSLPGNVLSVVLSGAALTEAQPRGTLRLSHWATCPDKVDWRAKQDAKAAAA